jgi:hypothetical protein
MAATPCPASAIAVSGWPEDQDGRGARRKGLQRASLSIPEATGEEKRLHPRDGERVKAKFPPSDRLLAAPASVSGQIRPGKTAAVARRRVINLVWPKKAEDWPAATKRAVWHSLENLGSIAI